ncbi:MAG: hypothetical protein Fur0041_15760 [Bacteroidia bacterium]
MNLRKLKIAVFILIFVLSGFFREFVFLNINEQIRITYYQVSDGNVAPMMQWLSGLSYPQLYYSKWILTFAFSVYFCLFAAFIIRTIFGNPVYTKTTYFVYGAVFLVSVFFYAAGWLAGNTETTYDIARFLAGLLETPAMLVILSGSFLVFENLKGK